jgi:hypothetical protein
MKVCPDSVEIYLPKVLIPPPSSPSNKGESVKMGGPCAYILVLINNNNKTEVNLKLISIL